MILHYDQLLVNILNTEHNKTYNNNLNMLKYPITSIVIFF